MKKFKEFLREESESPTDFTSHITKLNGDYRKLSQTEPPFGGRKEHDNLRANLKKDMMDAFSHPDVTEDQKVDALLAEVPHPYMSKETKMPFAVAYPEVFKNSNISHKTLSTVRDFLSVATKTDPNDQMHMDLNFVEHPGHTIETIEPLLKDVEQHKRKAWNMVPSLQSVASTIKNEKLKSHPVVQRYLNGHF